MRKVLVWSVWCFVALIAPTLHAQHSARELLALLSSADPDDRVEAATELRERGPPWGAIEPLIAAAKREGDHGVLVEMLSTLGESGALEALGLLQLHAISPAKDLRGAGRKALRRWLIVNRVLGPDDSLPEPPHPFYGPPPSFDADRPAGRPLPFRSEDQPSVPVYEPPPPGGVPPGFHFDCVARDGLVLAGALTLGFTYLAPASYGIVEAIRYDGDLAWIGMIPIAGPIIFGIEGQMPAWYVVAGVHVGGMALLAAGFAARRLRLARGYEARITPGGIDVRAAF